MRRDHPFHGGRLRPGEPAPASGQYQEVGNGGIEGREVTVARGQPLPPASSPDATYRPIDPREGGLTIEPDWS